MLTVLDPWRKKMSWGEGEGRWFQSLFIRDDLQTGKVSAGLYNRRVTVFEANL